MPPRGTVLAIDTSGPVGSVALAKGGRVVQHRVLTGRSAHASGLLPLVDEVLLAGAVDRSELDAVVVGEGPGSFTGVRVAAATAKGLCRALDLPLWPVSSLAGAAMAASGAGRIRYALFDARAERVYGACFGVGASGVRTLTAPHAAELRDLLAGDLPPGVSFVGAAAEAHRALIEGAGFPVASTDTDSSIAVGLITWLARHEGAAAADDIGAWEPEYVKASSAERLWSP